MPYLTKPPKPSEATIAQMDHLDHIKGLLDQMVAHHGDHPEHMRLVKRMYRVIAQAQHALRPPSN